eukprot:scaffold5172_cov150-Isochrysis_galbana.AAC.4
MDMLEPGALSRQAGGTSRRLGPLPSPLPLLLPSAAPGTLPRSPRRRAAWRPCPGRSKPDARLRAATRRCVAPRRLYAKSGVATTRTRQLARGSGANTAGELRLPLAQTIARATDPAPPCRRRATAGQAPAPGPPAAESAPPWHACSIVPQASHTPPRYPHGSPTPDATELRHRRMHRPWVEPSHRQPSASPAPRSAAAAPRSAHRPPGCNRRRRSWRLGAQGSPPGAGRLGARRRVGPR